jgi:hypothetical protein
MMGGIASVGDSNAAVMMRCYEMKVEKFSSGGNWASLHATLGREGSGPSRADRRQWEVKPMKRGRLLDRDQAIREV